MWVLIAIGVLTVYCLASSISVAKAKSLELTGLKKVSAFIQNLIKQLIYSAIALFLSGYVFSSLNENSSVAGTTHSTPEFIRSLFDCVGSFFCFYVIGIIYVMQAKGSKGEDD